MRRAFAVAAAAALLAAGCGGSSPEEVVRAWSDALNHGLNDEAAAYFAPGALVVSPEAGELRLADAAEAEAFNASIACQGEIIALSVAGDVVTATFRLDQRGTFACPEPLTVDTAAFTVRDGKILRWERLED